MLLRIAFAAPVIFLFYFLDGCTYGRTNEFIAPEAITNPNLHGWEIKPDIFSCRNIVSKEPCGELFFIGLELSRHRPKKKAIGDIVFLEIDTLSISFESGGNHYTCPMYSANWVSVSDIDEMSRKLSFEGPINRRFVRIPQSIKEIELDFTVRVREGYHLFATREGSNVPLDTISPQGEILQLMPMKIRLVRHEMAQKVPFFFQ